MVEQTEHQGEKMPVIGIDLGTYNSVVGAWSLETGKAEICKNAQGVALNRSVVSFGAQPKVGYEAEQRAKIDPFNAIFNSKRLMGAEDAVNEGEFGGAQVVKEKLEAPKLVVKQGEADVKIKPEEVAAMILRKMKDIAETHSGKKPLRNAVITVPANFNEPQRNLTEQAGKAAGLNVLRVINEPTAAALAYGLEQKDKVAANVLVYDFGGGTLDVTILNIDKTKEVAEYNVTATNGDCHLGGADFDKLLYYHVNEAFEEETGVDIEALPRDEKIKPKMRLHRACEQAKIALSEGTETEIDLEGLVGHDFTMSITREKAEELWAPLFARCKPLVEQTLKECDLTPGQIDEVVLVGGTCRIPKVVSDLSAMFDGKQLNYKVNPDEAVALGATILAASIMGYTESIDMVDILPLSLGIEVVPEDEDGDSDGDWLMATLIPKNSKLPAKFEKVFTTTMNNAAWIKFAILQGEDPIADKNVTLGKIKLQVPHLLPAGEPQIVVTFDVDRNGVLAVTAKVGDGAQEEVSVEVRRGTISEKDLDQLARMEAKSAYEDLVSELMDTLNDDDKSEKLDENEKATLEEMVNQCNAFIMETPFASKDEYEGKKQEIKVFFDPILARLQ